MHEKMDELIVERLRYLFLNLEPVNLKIRILPYKGLRCIRSSIKRA